MNSIMGVIFPLSCPLLPASLVLDNANFLIQMNVHSESSVTSL